MYALMNAINLVDRHTYAFEDIVWPAARQKGIGLVAMKVFGGGIKTCKCPPNCAKPRSALPSR
jgi:uncharacterized protein